MSLPSEPIRNRDQRQFTSAGITATKYEILQQGLEPRHCRALIKAYTFMRSGRQVAFWRRQLRRIENGAG